MLENASLYRINRQELQSHIEDDDQRAYEKKNISHVEIQMSQSLRCHLMGETKMTQDIHND